MDQIEELSPRCEASPSELSWFTGYSMLSDTAMVAV
jgi:hypothetical protein